MSPHSHSKQDTAEPGYMLGKTGETVVYIFPDGDALMDRDKTAAQTKLNARQSPAPTAAPTPTTDADRHIRRLVATGCLSAAQASVVRYDIESTGLSWQDALQARGWWNSAWPQVG